MRGRPRIPIDWDDVDLMLEAECPGTEIACSYGMTADAFYRRFQEHHGENLTTYETSKRKLGEHKLRKAQYIKALSGDNTMLIWLGKQRLNQREPQSNEHQVTPQQVQTLASHTAAIDQAQAAVRQLDSTTEPSAIREALDQIVSPASTESEGELCPAPLSPHQEES